MYRHVITGERESSRIRVTTTFSQSGEFIKSYLFQFKIQALTLIWKIHKTFLIHHFVLNYLSCWLNRRHCPLLLLKMTAAGLSESASHEAETLNFMVKLVFQFNVLGFISFRHWSYRKIYFLLTVFFTLGSTNKRDLQAECTAKYCNTVDETPQY